MHRFRWIGVFVLAVCLAATAVPAQGAAPSRGTAVRAALAAPVAAAPKPPRPLKYTPRRGVRINDPLSKDRKNVILNQIVNTIKAVPKKEKIRIASWNIRSDRVYRALTDAHRRGVSVQVLIAYGNANPQAPNPGFNRLQRALKVGNAKRDPALRSFARACRASCRGTRGIAHSKYYLFSKAGTAQQIVMYGSANATDLAAGYQWNDLMTFIGRQDVYDDFTTIFNQSKKDRPARPAYAAFDYDTVRMEFLPWAGKGSDGDPILNELEKVSCKGATGKTGINGRTKIRIAQTATLGKRGARIAHRLVKLYDQGCNIRIVYAVMGNEVLRILRKAPSRGPVPIRQITQDFQNDGVYDRYLHMKAMTIEGVYGKQTDARVTFNGSTNWSGLALLSDDIGGRLFNATLTKKYAAWVDHLWNHPPRQFGTTTSTSGGGIGLRASARAAGGGEIVAPRKVGVWHGIEH